MIANYRQAVQVAEPEPPEPEINFVEYIESSGTQYIDTGFKPNNNTRVVMDIWPKETSTRPFFGAREGSGKNFIAWIMSATEYRSDFYNNNRTVTTSNTASRISLDKNGNVCHFGTVSANNADGSFQTPLNMFLLATWTNGAIDSRKMAAKLYSCQIYDNNVLIRDYAPVIDPDGVPCLYEKLSEQYVYNSGAGSFTAPS